MKPTDSASLEGGTTVAPRRNEEVAWNGMSPGTTIAIGAVTGLALGILVSVTTDLPLAPELGVLLGVLAGWLVGREAAS